MRRRVTHRPLHDREDSQPKSGRSSKRECSSPENTKILQPEEDGPEQCIMRIYESQRFAGAVLGNGTYTGTYILILVFASKCPKTFSECHTDLLLWKPSADSVGLAEKLLGADGQ